MQEIYLSLADVGAGIATFERLGYMTDAVWTAIERWFGDVYIPLPIKEMELEEEERDELVLTVLSDMEGAFSEYFTDKVTMTDEEALTALQGRVDPLWRELVSLHAFRYNILWDVMCPQTDEDRDERIAQIEMMSGMSRQELAERALEDTRLRMNLMRSGIRVEDLS